MTKTELKSIIKECLLEILTDGLGESLNEASQRKKVSKQIIEKKETDRRMIQQKREVGNTISAVTSDPILQSVLAHTAKTTLREQLQNDRTPRVSGEGFTDDFEGMGGGDPGLDISQIFGSASKNWSEAAFSDKKR